MDTLALLNEFVLRVVRHRQSSRSLAWANWIREDLASRPCEWLRPEFVPPAPYLVCRPQDSPNGSGILVQPALIDAHFRKAWMPYFRREGHPVVTTQAFLEFVGDHLPQEPLLDLPILTGEDLYEAAMAKKSTAGGLDGWAWNEIKALSLSWFVGLALVLRQIEAAGRWPQGLLDAYIAMIPKAEGDSTPLGQRPSCVLPVVYRLWASVRLAHLKDWFSSWVPDSVFTAGKGVSSVDAWYATAIGIEEVLSQTRPSDFHIFVADVVKSFDTVDRDILDCTLGRLGLPAWFRRVYFSFHQDVRLRFKLAAGLGVAWTRDGGILQGCPLSMIFIIALYTPWCRYLESRASISPQLCADNLKCTSYSVDSLLDAAQYTVAYVRAVGQEASPSKCVLLSTSSAARRRMTAWRNRNEGCFWAVKLDVRDLGGHLDVTLRAVAGTLTNRIKIATTQVPAVGALRLVFQRMLGMVRSKFLPGGLHGCEGAAVSVTALSSFRSAISRAVWSKKLPMTNTPALLNLLDSPWGSDPAFFIIWNRFRQFRRFLAYRPDDHDRIFRLLDYASAGAPGHGPIHLLIQSADELGFFWDSEQAGWIRPGLPPLRMLTGPVQHFRSAIWQAWQHRVATDLCKRKGFRGGFGFDIYGSHQQLVSSHLRERDKMLLRAILSGRVWNGFLLSKVKKEDVPCRFCGAPDNDGHLFWDCTFPPFVELRNQPEFIPLMSQDRTRWPRCLLWQGWLPGLSSRTVGTPWAFASSDLASSCLEHAFGSYPLDASSAWQPFWDQDDVQDMVDDVPENPNIWTDGSREPIPHLDIEIAGAGAFIHSPAIVFDSHHWGHAQDLDDLHEGSSHIFSGIPGPIQSVQRAEYLAVILALQAYSGIHIGIDNLNVLRGVAGLLSHRVPRSPLALMKDGDLLFIIHSMLSLRGFDTVKVSEVKGHATPAMVASGDVRAEHLVGNDGADTAADLGRLRQSDDVITARRNLLRVRRLWYPIMLDLHRFMVAVSRIEVNYDGFGGTAPDALVWDQGGIVKARAPTFRLIVDCAFLPGPPDFLNSTWIVLDPLPITAEDVAAWPYSVDILIFSSFWPLFTGHRGSLIWESLVFLFLNFF